MDTPTARTLKVPGATLYYETRGSGPVLLLIPGGGADAAVYAAIAPALADAGYTVVAQDPRGQSRSTLDGPPAGQRPADWADDARRLLDEVSPHGPAYVLGCSAGAIAAIDLLARYPERVRRVVAHEPPLVEVLEDPAPYRALFAEVRALFLAEGGGPAMARFGEGLGTPDQEREPDEPAPEVLEMMPRAYGNTPFFLEHVLCPFTGSTPDLPALRKASARLVTAAGRDSRPQPALHGPARRLAELTGARFAEFPGGHLGCTQRPAEFAERLLEVLADGDGVGDR
ncbi:alpha/beta hydrolase [Streptomyces sp. SPB4]|uniref:alpha/beta fold hydrolase n=1 Tax=Streptomyces TaxID=1883 RepID=UPI002476D25A|nr:alpha/beta hydrolase [Streptomyces sp. SPB4]MDH6543479.1 pimeloyl-ACP methyl ester carboxylesterase [Streptomyces sp. SPB4]